MFDLYRGKGIDNDKRALHSDRYEGYKRPQMTDDEVEVRCIASGDDAGSTSWCKIKNLGAVMTLTKAELADLLFEKVGWNKREAKDMVGSVL